MRCPELPAEDGGSFFNDDHLCLSCQSKVSAPTLKALNEAKSDYLRESHEGGTLYFQEAMEAYEDAWQQAIHEIHSQ